ncbi:MAG: lipopolysaccharide biosynthesis protein [Candidatus Pacebacteria bacterium]|nr:lipopolysaccharide biosynthesis protein [Candidatus Paceibacterota bacterium]
MGYTRDAIFGLRWLTFLKVCTKGLVLLKIVILARILSPRDFGLFGIVVIMLALTEMLTETGINPFLVQTTKDPKKYINTAWHVSVLRGIVISAILTSLTYPLSWFYREPTIVPLMWVAVCIPLIKGFINPSVALFQRTFAYHKDVIIRLILIVVDVLSAIGLAYLLRSPVALILSQLISVCVETAITLAFVSPKPRLNFEFTKFKEVLRFGAWLNVSGVLAYLGSNLDNLIIAKLLGTSTLGYYDTAFNVSQTAIGEIGDISAQTVFPIFGKITHDLPRLTRAFFLSIFLLAVLLLAPLAALFFYAEPLVRFVLGEKWLPIVPILPFLLGAAYMQAINNICSPLFIVKQKTYYNALMTFLYLIAMVPLLFYFIPRGGFVGAGWALLLARLIVQPAFFLSSWHTLRSRR